MFCRIIFKILNDKNYLMKENNKNAGNKKNVAFAIFYLASIALVILFFTFFNHKKPSAKIANTIENNSEPQKQLLTETDILLNKLIELQKADERYASLFVQSSVTPAMDSVDTQISIYEANFKNVIDSFSQTENNYSGNNKILFNKINEYFKQTLENRRAIGNIRYALAAGNFSLDSNQKKWLKLNSDLLAKNKRIEELENLLQSNSDNINSQIEKSNAELAPLQATINRQQIENDNLKQNIKSLNTTISTLQSNLAAKATNSTQNQTSSADLEKIQQLNDEIQLAKISCNLTRADAQQIISNSKERKELLTDALQSLINLSKSSNPEIRQKANSKLKELQRIAGTIRD